MAAEKKRQTDANASASAPLNMERLLVYLLQLIGRKVFSTDEVKKVVDIGRANLKAFNLCDGTRTQKEIAKKLKIDQGQLSRTFKKWIEAGIALRIGEGNQVRLLHVFPIRIASNRPKKAKRKNKRRGANRR